MPLALHVGEVGLATVAECRVCVVRRDRVVGGAAAVAVFLAIVRVGLRDLVRVGASRGEDGVATEREGRGRP